MRIDLDPQNPRKRKDADWLGNNAAFTCPNHKCRKVFVVSGQLNPSGRECPQCSKSKGFSAKDGSSAYLEYKTDESSSFWRQRIDLPWWQLLLAGAGIHLFVKGVVGDFIAIGLYGLAAWDGVKKGLKRVYR